MREILTRRNLPFCAVLRGVVAEDVVVRDRLLGLNDAAGQVVVIEERFAAGIAGQRIQRVLRLLKVGGGGQGGGAGVHARVAGRALGRVAERSLRDQAARVDRPERNTGFDRGVNGGVKLGLVVDAVEAESAGKVDERFLLVQLAEHFRRGLQSGELAVGVEDVELAVVLAEGGAGIGAAGVVDCLSDPWPSPTIMRLQDAEQLVAIGGEVLQDVDRAALVAQDGDEIGGCHLGAEELFRGRERAQLVGRPHGGHVEIKSQQAAILVAFVFRRFGRDLGAGEALVEFDLFGCRGARRARATHWRRGPDARRKLIFCGTPSSVIAKSLAVSPWMSLPCLSFTTTVSTTSCDLTVSVKFGDSLGDLFWPVC